MTVVDQRRRWPAGLRKTVGGLAMLSVAVLVVPGSSGADEPAPFGMAARGTATGLHIIVNRTGTAPLEPMVGVLLGTVSGQLNEQTGVTATVASSLYPGDAAESPKGVFALVGLPVAGNLFPTGHPFRDAYDAVPGFIPNYPLVTSASYPGAQGKRVDMFGEALALAPSVYPMEVRGMVQEAAAADGYANSKASVGALVLGNPLGLAPEVGAVVDQLTEAARPFVDAPTSGPALSVHGLESSYEAIKGSGEGRTATTTRVSGVDILGGLVELGDVHSTAVQAADGNGTRLVEAGSEIGFAKVLGIRGSLSDRGFELADARIPADQAVPVSQLIGQILDRIGLTVSAVGSHEQGSRFTAESFSVSFKAQEPPVPAASVIGRESRIVLRFGVLESELSTFPVRGQDLAGEEIAGLDDVSATRDTGGSSAAISAIGGPPSGFDGLGAIAGPSGSEPGETTGVSSGLDGDHAPLRPLLPSAGSGIPGVPAPGDSAGRIRPGVELAGAADAALEVRRASATTDVANEFKGLVRRLVLLGIAGFGAALFVWRRRPMSAG